MKRILIIGSMIFVVGLVGCRTESGTEMPAEGSAQITTGEPESSSPTEGSQQLGTLPSQVERAVSIARAIREDPEQAESILSEHHLSISQFENLMYEIAADPELSTAYERAMR